MASHFVVCVAFLLLAAALNNVQAQSGARIDFPTSLAGYNLVFQAKNTDACGLNGYDYSRLDANAATSSSLIISPGSYANITISVFSAQGNGPYKVSVSASGSPDKLTPITTIINVPGDKSPVGPVPAGISYPFSFNAVVSIPGDIVCPASGCLIAVSNDNGVVSCSRFFAIAGYQSAYKLNPGFFKNTNNINSSANSTAQVPPQQSQAAAAAAATIPSSAVTQLQIKLRSKFVKLLKIFKALKIDAGILYKRIDVLRDVAILTLQF